MIFIFLFCIIILIYIYLGYPASVFILSKFSEKKICNGEYEPYVTILIAAYNEEKHIKATIKNKLNLDYPKNKLEIIVISDGSDDTTDEIVQGFENQGVRLIRQEPRKGKTSALNLAVPDASGEIIVFSDANSIYASDSLKNLVKNFQNPDIGYVTGRMIYINPDGSSVGDGCSAYMKYENFLRKYETRLGSIVGVDGGIDAVRKALYKPMSADQLPDFVLPLMVIKQGYRVVYEPASILMEKSLDSPEDEYKMRVRVTLRALWALHDMRKLLDVKKYKIFSWQLFSHKHLRYLAFIFMVGAYVFNALIITRSAFYALIYLAQNIFYVGVLITHFKQIKGKETGILFIPYYFALINIAAAHAFLKFVFGKKQVLWTPRKG